MNGGLYRHCVQSRMLGTDKALTTEWQSWNKDYIKNVANCLNGKSISRLMAQARVNPIKGQLYR